jgi:hypothetical protein
VLFREKKRIIKRRQHDNMGRKYGQQKKNVRIEPFYTIFEKCHFNSSKDTKSEKIIHSDFEIRERGVTLKTIEELPLYFQG